jgi:NAD(P)H-hydrate epimerase
MSLPILSIAQMRTWEQATWQTGRTEAEVIARVGRAVAERALALTQPGQRILLLAGKGHNGDDTRAAREHLRERRVDLLEVTSPAEDLAKLEAHLQPPPALIVDGLFGIGLNRPLDESWRNFIARVNAAALLVLAVDVPSGLNADTGEPFGAAIEATVTLTVGAPKLGCFGPGAERFVGRLEVADDVGLIPWTGGPEAGECRWTQPADFAHFPPRRAAASHKGAHGHLAIIAGSLGFHGAAVLATRGALRAQPGLVSLFTPENVYHAVAPHFQSAMLKPWNAAVKFATEFSAVLIGPGLAAADLPADMKPVARKLWRDSLLPVIVDASALDWLPLDPVPRNALRVITPHPGEAARLLKCSVNQIQSRRLSALREVSARFGSSWVVLKGHQTLIGRDTGEVLVNGSGNPHLAQGGSGDLLAGYLAGLLAQPALQSSPAKTISFAVWQHGAAADALQARQANWTIEDLAREIGAARP